MTITWSVATAADIDEFYGERPGESLRAVVVRLDGRPAAIIGVAIERTRARAFSEYKPELEPHLKSIPVMRAIKAAQQMFAASGRPVVAVCDGSAALLVRLGFVQLQDDIYLWRS
jgi:hypothetical protein